MALKMNTGSGPKVTASRAWQAGRIPTTKASAKPRERSEATEPPATPEPTPATASAAPRGAAGK